MTQEEFARRVLEAARELCAFEDEEAVAAFLLAQGCKGEPLWPCDCPVARFIRKRVYPSGGGESAVTVGSDSVTVLDWSSGIDEQGGPALHTYVGFTQSVKDFIRSFDHHGLFPELVEVSA